MKLRITLLIALGILAPGCSILDKLQTDGDESAVTSDQTRDGSADKTVPLTDGLVNELADYTRLPADERETLLARESRNIKPGFCGASSIRAAMLAYLASKPTANIQDTLSPCSAETELRDTPMIDIAQLILYASQERDRLKTELSRTNNLNHRGQDETARLETQLREARAQIANLQKQLDGLKAIERSLQERTAPAKSQ